VLLIAKRNGKGSGLIRSTLYPILPAKTTVRPSPLDLLQVCLQKETLQAVIELAFT
jgi:hypothetical protein